MASGADLNVLRGVVIDQPLLDRLIDAAPSGDDGQPMFIGADFRFATFEGDCTFGGVRFQRWASFQSATFEGLADFAGVNFARITVFEQATFVGRAFFGRTTFGLSGAVFDGASFCDIVHFTEMEFLGPASFTDAVFVDVAFVHDVAFQNWVSFRSAVFKRGLSIIGCRFDKSVSFDRAAFYSNLYLGDSRFESVEDLGYIGCTGLVNVNGCRFGAHVEMAVAAREIQFLRSDFTRGVRLSMRRAAARIDARLGGLSTMTFRPEPHPREDSLGLDNGKSARPRIESLQRMDLRQLTIGDVDLTNCMFANAQSIEGVRIDSKATFGRAPRWRSRRCVLAEECVIRSKGVDDSPWADVYRPHAWTENTSFYARASPTVVTPGRMAAVYRSLRRSFEVRGNEPGAADFYYGEMEMRRLAKTTPFGERFILGAYWALSGYGLRAWRALTWLGVTVLCLAFLLMHVGFQSMVADDGFLASLLFSVGSATSVFGVGSSDLTQPGEVIRISLRVAGPVLIALSVLAIRARIKR